MAAFLIRRIFLAIPTLFGVTLVVFLAVHYAPGDPARARLGARATAAALNQERERLGLNDPAIIQYFRFLGHLLQGDLGTSLRTQRLVKDEITEYFPATIELTLFAMLIAVIFGVGLGVISAIYQKTIFDYASMTFALVGVSMPIFWLGLTLMLLFTAIFPGWPTSQRIGYTSSMLPITGFYLIDTLWIRDFRSFVDALQHLLLPSIALATIPLAIIARMTRAAMLEVIGLDYIRTARAKGLSSYTVYMKHAFRNALIPVLTIIGLQFGSLLGGAIITETIFSWPGVGTWILAAIENRDTYVIQGGVCLVSAAFILINILVDLLYAVVDPRIEAQ